jgi:hypothetical protein
VPYKQIKSTAFSGDFGTRYHAVMKMTFGPPEGMLAAGVIIGGRYVGTGCPASAAPQ